MKIFYGSGNILVSPLLDQGSSTQIEGFVSALEQAGHSVMMDLSGDRKLYPRVRSKAWLKWIKAHLPLSWFGYEVLQVLNNRRIYNRLRRVKLGNFDLLWQRYEMFTTAYSEQAQRAGIPNVLFVDAPLITEREQFGHLWLKKQAIVALRQNVKVADLVVAISNPVAEYVRKYVGDSGLPVHIMPNGFPPHILNASPSQINEVRERYFGDFKGTIVGFVGSIKPWHGVDCLVQASFRLSQERDDFRVLIVGDGPDLPAQKRLVKELGMSHFVKFTGNIPFSDIAPYLNVLDIGVMPDSNLYGSPMKIPEYMACGAAVVAPNLPPIAALCTHGGNSMLFPKDDVNALYYSIRQLLDSPALLARLQKNAQEQSLASYSWKARIQQVEPLLDDILPNGSR